MIQLRHTVRGLPMQAARAVTRARRTTGSVGARWLVLFHQIPPTPAYLRVKIGRRLARAGAVGLKNAVYAMPRSEGALEDLHWVIREIIEGGGEATLCEAQFIEGLSDDQVQERFREVRDEDYAALASEVRQVSKRLPAKLSVNDERRSKMLGDVERFERRLEEVAAIDFFHAPGREAAVGLVSALRARLAAPEANAEDEKDDGAASLRGRVWVTRTGVHIDRIASAWLVRRFVDLEARFKFVPAKGYRPEPGEMRFDMFEAEFTHEGDRCTFEVLVNRLSIREPGVTALAEVVHDIDLKEAKFERPETAGIAAAVMGLCTVHQDDEARLEAGFALFDHLKAHFSRKRS
jgi:hypothetical protein